ncbi:HNH endonuclease [Paenibacillus monticola]|uniref:HNH endonuclease n=1 Tax=Paenibacillus monticola TaxID=2666075 RepID=A0A7X2L2Z6_9BACL|nr:HNH endonuclease [Paenibacillus monticola]MRN55402.1 HNH endonuclease [Paenibacillus monticola]
MTDTNLPLSKECIYCHQNKPLSEFRRRTGKRSKGQSRRGACRECRKQRETAETKNLPQVAPITRLSDSRSLSAAPQPISAAVPALLSAKPAAVKAHQHSLPERSREGKSLPPSSVAKAKARTRGAEQPRIHPHLRGPKPEPQDTSALIPSAKGLILMRGHSDKGRRWHQEIDFELAVTLVNERAAVVINRRTIRRIYSNKDFRAMILTRDNYTCHFCGLYGDTIDHLLPRAKGGHTTPENCVCACNLCNQTKADQYVEEFMGR